MNYLWTLEKAHLYSKRVRRGFLRFFFRLDNIAYEIHYCWKVDIIGVPALFSLLLESWWNDISKPRRDIMPLLNICQWFPVTFRKNKQTRIRSFLNRPLVVSVASSMATTPLALSLQTFWTSYSLWCVLGTFLSLCFAHAVPSAWNILPCCLYVSVPTHFMIQ